MIEEEKQRILRSAGYKRGYDQHKIYMDNGQKWPMGMDGGKPSEYKTYSPEHMDWLSGAYSALGMNHQGIPPNTPPINASIRQEIQLDLFSD